MERISHNHGPDEGAGTSCREQTIDGHAVGECISNINVMQKPNLSAIKGRIVGCATYNFGMYQADKLAHEDAPVLVSYLEQTERNLAVVHESQKNLAKKLARTVGEKGKAEWRAMQAESQIEKVRELHEEYIIYMWDEETNFPKLDENGNRIILDRMCRACTPFDTICAGEDGDWDDSYPSVYYPCPTIKLLDTTFED